MDYIKKDMVRLPPHSPNSKKGDFGKVLVVGGSEDYYGAPIIAACAAENSGADLITLYLPNEYKDTARNYSLNFFLKKFRNENLTIDDVENIVSDSKENHVLIIGNGIGKTKEAKQAVLAILTKISIPVVIDAEALFPEILKIKPANAKWVITPHKAEFERLFVSKFDPKTIGAIAKKHNLTILAKCIPDYIASDQGKVVANNSGCALMRVGGTGDALAGITGSFIAQGLNSFEAACSAAYYWGKCGSILAKKRKWLLAHIMIKKFSKIVLEIEKSDGL